VEAKVTQHIFISMEQFEIDATYTFLDIESNVQMLTNEWTDRR